MNALERALRDKRAAVWQQLAGIVDDEASGQLTPAQAAEWDVLSEQLRILDLHLAAFIRAAQKTTAVVSKVAGRKPMAGPGVSGYSEKGEFDFAVGSLFGLRMWSLEREGALKGSFGAVWGDGENVAVCPKAEELTHVLVLASVMAFDRWCKNLRIDPADPRMTRVSTVDAVTGKDHPADSRWVEVNDGYMPVPNLQQVRNALNERFEQAPMHEVRARMARGPDELHEVPGPGGECGCGYWAYWDPYAAKNTFMPERAVMGVVEGYGRTRIGAKGFRAAKARIVALCLMFDWKGDAGDYQKTLTEDRIIERYPSAKMYCSPEAMLMMHPPTTDYLPQPATPTPARKPLIKAVPKLYCPAGTELTTLDIRRDFGAAGSVMGLAQQLVRPTLTVEAQHDDGSRCDHIQQLLDSGESLTLDRQGGGSTVITNGSGGVGGSAVAGGGGGGVSYGYGVGGNVGGGGAAGVSGFPARGNAVVPGTGAAAAMAQTPNWAVNSQPQQVAHALGYGLTHHPNGQPRAHGPSPRIINYP